MPNTTTSPNMGLVLPVVLVDTGPDWATRIYNALNAGVDAHDHSAGNGVQITPAGINISADLGFGSFNATSLRSSRFTSQASPLALGSDVGCVYVSQGELWYNDGSARQVQLTLTGAVKSSPQVLLFKSVTTSYTILSTDLFQLFYAQTGSGAVAIGLPSSATVSQGRVYYIYDDGHNAATNNITVTPNGGDSINGVVAPFVISKSASLTILTTDSGGNWSANTIAVSSIGPTSTVALTTGTVTLTISQYNVNTIVFTGTLTGAVTIVLPNAVGEFTLDFSAVVMGGNTIAIKSGTATSATMGAALIGSTATTNQMTLARTYGSNTVRVKA